MDPKMGDRLWRNQDPSIEFDLPERRVEPAREIDLDDGGSWLLVTDSGSHYLLQLDGNERSIRRLAVDTSHVHPDGSHPLRRDGEAYPLLRIIDPPIQAGKPARLLVGEISDDPDCGTTTWQTSIVVDIRRVR